MSKENGEPFTSRSILVVEVEKGWFNVIVDGSRFAEKCAVDEVIGCFAMEILGHQSHVRYPIESPLLKAKYADNHCEKCGIAVIEVTSPYGVERFCKCK
jgi:hypothetical protein